MSILDRIVAIQKRPEPTRRRMLAISVGLLMIGIVGAWMMLLTRSLALPPSEKAAAEKRANERVLSPFSLLKSTITDGIETLRAQL